MLSLRLDLLWWIKRKQRHRLIEENALSSILGHKKWRCVFHTASSLTEKKMFIWCNTEMECLGFCSLFIEKLWCSFQPSCKSFTFLVVSLLKQMVFFLSQSFVALKSNDFTFWTYNYRTFNDIKNGYWDSLKINTIATIRTSSFRQSQ